MGLSGKLVAQVEIKSHGDLFHKLFRHEPHHVSKICPKYVHSCELNEGEWGAVGSVISWKYIHEEKECVAKEVIESIDEEKKSIRFKVIEGDLLHSYKHFASTMNVEKVDEKHLVTWTFEYEKLHEDTPHPTKIVDLVLSVTKDVETHHYNHHHDSSKIVTKDTETHLHLGSSKGHFGVTKDTETHKDTESHHHFNFSKNH